MLLKNLSFFTGFSVVFCVFICLTSTPHATERREDGTESSNGKFFEKLFTKKKGKLKESKASPLSISEPPSPSTPPAPAYLSYPEDVGSIISAIKEKTPQLFVYIPETEDRKLVESYHDFPLFMEKHLDSLTELTVQLYPHMMRSENCEWAAYPWRHIIEHAPNLQKITLAHNIVEFLLPYVRKEISVFIDCEGVHTMKETIIFSDIIEGRRKKMIAHCEKNYPSSKGYTVQVLELNAHYKKK